MRSASLLLACLMALVAARAENFLDRVDEMLTFSALNDRARLRLSGTIDLEYFHIDKPPFGVINSSANDLFSPRLSLFLDAQLCPHYYAFAQARIDRGFDPGDRAAQVRMDEYALRFTPWENSRVNLQIGKFAPSIGNWMSRHLSWDNPFVTAPLPYENPTAISDLEVPSSPGDFVHHHDADSAYEYNPIIWSAGYTTGVSISGRLGKFEYAAEVKNAALSSRPESWDATEIGFEHPTISARLGWHPSATWTLGFSASRGAYLRPETGHDLPPGRNIGDYQQLVLGQDISFAMGHLQIWAEIFEARFEVPTVGDADTVAYYVEVKYKFSPEFFAAVRWNQQLFADVPDGSGGTRQWDDDVWRADTALGYRFTPHTQFKVQYSLQAENGSRGQSHTVGVQFTIRF